MIVRRLVAIVGQRRRDSQSGHDAIRGPTPLVVALALPRRGDAKRAHLAIEIAPLDAEHLGGPGDVALLPRQGPEDVVALELVARLVQRPQLGGPPPVRACRPPPRNARSRAVDHLARHHDHQPLDDVPQLPHVARPRVVRQDAAAHHRRASSSRRPYSRANSRMKCSRQQRDVLLAIAQRRHEDRDDVEPEVQVLPEPAGLDLAGQVLVGGGEHARVHPDAGACRRPARRPAPAAPAAPWPASSGSCRRSRRGRSCRRRPARTCRAGPTPRR